MNRHQRRALAAVQRRDRKAQMGKITKERRKLRGKLEEDLAFAESARNYVRVKYPGKTDFEIQMLMDEMPTPLRAALVKEILANVTTAKTAEPPTALEAEFDQVTLRAGF